MRVFAPELLEGLGGSCLCSTRSWIQSTKQALGLRKQLSLHLLFIKLKAANEVHCNLGQLCTPAATCIPILLQCGSVTGSDVPAAEGRNVTSLCLAALSEYLEMVSVWGCVCGVFASQLVT